MNPKRKRHLKIAAAMREIYKATDEGTESSKAQDPDATKITCKRGCNACCKMNVLISGAEAVAIVERYPELVKERLEVLQAQSKVVEQLCAQILPANKTSMMTEQESNAIADEWWKLQLPCPLLLDNGDCGVYDARPIPCRTHFVISEPELCSQVPAVIIGHWIPPHRNDVYKATVEMWFALVGNNRWPVGSLPKMLLLAYRERKATL